MSSDLSYVAQLVRVERVGQVEDGDHAERIETNGPARRRSRGNRMKRPRNVEHRQARSARAPRWWLRVAAAAGGVVLLARCDRTPIVEFRSDDATRSLTLNHSGIVLHADGLGRLVIGAGPKGGLGLSIHDEKGKRRLSAGMQANGKPRFALFDPDGNPRTVADLGADGSPSLSLLDHAGTERATLAVEGDGSPRVSLLDAGGTQRAGLVTNVDGAVGLVLFSDDGAQRALLNVEPDGLPGLVLYDGEGVARVVVEILPDGRPRLELWDEGYQHEEGSPEQSEPEEPESDDHEPETQASTRGGSAPLVCAAGRAGSAPARGFVRISHLDRP